MCCAREQGEQVKFLDCFTLQTIYFASKCVIDGCVGMVSLRLSCVFEIKIKRLTSDSVPLSLMVKSIIFVHC